MLETCVINFHPLYLFSKLAFNFFFPIHYSMVHPASYLLRKEAEDAIESSYVSQMEALISIIPMQGQNRTLVNVKHLIVIL